MTQQQLYLHVIMPDIHSQQKSLFLTCSYCGGSSACKILKPDMTITFFHRQSSIKREDGPVANRTNIAVPHADCRECRSDIEEKKA